jgi:hypothetical protein
MLGAKHTWCPQELQSQLTSGFFATTHYVFGSITHSRCNHRKSFAPHFFHFAFFSAGGLYWSLAFWLNLLDNNLLTVSQMTSWESLA